MGNNFDDESEKLAIERSIKWLCDCLDLALNEISIKGQKANVGQTFLHNFIWRHKRGIDQDPRVMDFLHEAFCNILSGKPTDKALFLSEPRGRKAGPRRPNGKNFEDGGDVIGQFAERKKIYERVKFLREKHQNLEICYEIISDETGYSETTVKRIYLWGNKLFS